MKKYLKWGSLKCQNLLFGWGCGVQMFLPGVKDAVSSVPARLVPGSCLSQDLRIWVQPLWDAGQALKGYVQSRLGVPKVGEMELS